MKIRIAADTDSAALLEIYAQYIDTPVTFECVLPTKAEFRRRIENIATQYPYLVCEAEGKLIGYAYAHRHMKRAAYQWNTELSVYLRREFTSKGIGTALYRILIDILKLQGVKTVYAGVTVPNEKSEALHRTLGFREIGVYRNTGYKHGWQSVVWFEKEIAPYSPEPEPVLPISRISEKEILGVIHRHNR